MSEDSYITHRQMIGEKGAYTGRWLSDASSTIFGLSQPRVRSALENTNQSY